MSSCSSPRFRSREEFRTEPHTEPHTMKAIWKNQVIAESDDTLVVDGNHYFRPGDVRQDLLEPSETRTTCGWKGQASYYHVVVGGERNPDAAWFYPDPKPEAEELRGRLAFWKGVATVE